MANAKVQEYLKGLQTEKANLIKAAQDAIKELNEVGEVLGFSYSLTLDDDDQTAKPPKSAGGSTGNRKQMKPEDIKAAKETILDHLRTTPDENTQAAIFTAAGWPKTSWQTYGKHLEALVKDEFVIKSNKTDNFKELKKGEIAAAVNAHNPYVYKWVKDLNE
jgi:hypothetical protein